MVDDLGDEAIGFTFETGPVGAAGAIYAFRVGNAMFVVAGSGSVEARDILAVARTIAARAQGETS